MKKLILGVSMFFTGFIGFAILCGAAVTSTYTSGSTYFLDIWRLFGITPVAVIFLVLGFVGLVLAVIGAFANL